MKTAGIICEYNPLHNGHVHHIQEVRKTGVTHVICVLSDDFVQRGDVALLDKFSRAQLALSAGADLVIELPFPFSCASAEIYAGKAISLLHRLHVIDMLSFGASAHHEDLQRLSQADRHPEKIRECMKAGESYPAAVYHVMQEQDPALAEILKDPNHLLAVEYLRAMQSIHADFEIYAVRRNTVMHDSHETKGMFASASYLRKYFDQQDISDFIPPYTADLLATKTKAHFSRLERLILYKIRMMSEAELLQLPDMNASLAGRFCHARHADSLEAFLNAIRTKCVTLARIRRMIIYALTGIRKEDMQKEIPYARILAFHENSRDLIRKIRKNSEIPISTSLADLKAISPDFVRIQTQAADVYGLAQEKINSFEQEFRRKIIMQRS